MSCGKEKMFMIRAECPIEGYMKKHTERYKAMLKKIEQTYFVSETKPEYGTTAQPKTTWTNPKADDNPITYISQDKYDKGIIPQITSTTKNTAKLENLTSTDAKNTNAEENQLEEMIRKAKEETGWTQPAQYHTQDPS
jgi:hypothetical protein